jgi:hypothetical protein
MQLPWQSPVIDTDGVIYGFYHSPDLAPVSPSASRFFPAASLAV